MVWGPARAGHADDLTFTARVDKTTVELGTPIQLTLTLDGDLESVQQLPTVTLPEGFEVAAHQQTSSVVVKQGAAHQSVTLIYQLVPQRAGTFALGPFTLQRKGGAIPTQAIQITVEKPALPPSLGSSGPRYSL